MAHKMKKVKGDLYSIEEEGHRLNLVPHHIPIRAAGSTSQDTISSTNVDRDTEMVGRDTEKEHIIKLLLKSEVEEDISIIPIVGLGGMGKTTLAQAVYLDKRAEIFDLRVWVYVSKKLDLQRIGEIIISKANRSIGSGTTERYVPRINDDLQTIIEDMQNILPTKRYLIILDDMWEEGVVKLKNLKYMLQYGAKGSKIILTTRKQQVVENLNVGFLSGQRKICPVQKSDQINLNSLSVEDCWNVMRQMAFRRDEDLGRLEEIGKKIAEKCRSLPLLARSLGFLMSQDKSTQAWEDIRDKKIILDMEEDQETLQSLMLSFYYMPLDFKLCFTYCAVFPKGFVISRDHLVQQWIALGYIESTKGYRCINYLLGMCFLQISKSSQSIQEHSTALEKLTMHDLVHDLAMIIAGNELIVPDAGKKTTWSGLERRYSRHMQLINYQKQSKALKEFPGKIRSLHFTECSRLLLQHISFSKSKYLRVLDLSGCSIEGKPAPSSKLLPSSIDQLLMLRYLDSSGLLITALPKSLHKLQNMQTLIMRNCALETVPNNIGHLHRLSYLDLSDNSSLTKLPISLGQLSALSFLNLSGCSRLEALPESVHKLECLQHIDISRCSALQNLPDKFGSLPKLLFLNSSSCPKLVKLPSNLKSLEHLNLSNCHELLNLPPDFGNLHKLEFLNLSNCYKIQILPESFCQLKHLKDLDLADCHDLKELPECFGYLSELQCLNLASCSKLQLLPESFGGLFKLKHLNLSYCVRLEKLCSLFGNLKLQVLDMNGCHNLHDLPKSLGNMTSLTRLRMSRGHFPTLVRARDILLRLKLPGCTIHDVHEMDKGECSSIVDLGQLTCHDLEIKQLENVKRPEEAERAKLRDNPELRELGLHWTRKSSITDADRCKLVLQHLIPPRTLEDFALIGYISKDFPKWMLDISSYLPYLMSIRLISLTACDSLPPLGQLPNLRLLHLMNIPNIRKVGKEFFGTEGTCKKLRVIELKSLENLDEWWTTRSGDEEEEFLIPNLHWLHVANCPKLKFRPYPPKSIYWYLEKNNEVLPAHGFGRLTSSTLPFHATIKNCIFSPDKWGRLQHLATLEELKILGDSSLRTLPEVTPCLPSLRYLHLHLVGLEILPEWLEQLTTLEEFRIFFCPNLTSLPKSIQKLTALKKLTIRGCPRLAESCQGEDAHKIRHIPEVVLDNKIFVQARPIE